MREALISPDWQHVTLGEVTESIQAGRSPDLEDAPAGPGQWGVLKVSAITPSGFLSHENKVVTEPALIDAALEVQPGDLLLSRANTSELVGLCCIAEDPRPNLMISDKILRIKTNRSKMDPVFLLVVLASTAARRQIEALATGTSGSMKNISQDSVRSLVIPCPPLEEQQRIGEMLDSINARIASTTTLVQKLERIEEGALRQQLSRLTKCRQTTVYNEFDIRSGVTLGQHRRPRSRPRPYLRVANVQRGWIDISDLALLEASEADERRWSLRTNDLLVVEGHANPDEIGRCALVKSGAAGLLYQNHLFRLRPRSVLPEFALLWLNSEFIRSYWRTQCATSSGLYTINSKVLARGPLPLVHRGEQDHIVQLWREGSTWLRHERQSIAKLRLIRQGLAEDLLSGKVRVR